jgi:hypothetical protein
MMRWACIKRSKVTEELRVPTPESFDDEPGEEAYSPDDIPIDREVITTPSDSPVRSLLDDIHEKNLIVNPEFQRLSVWDRTRKSKLIESLLLNIPIPVLFLAEDKDGTRVVVDGQQRLRAIEEFEAGQYRLSGLQVLSELNRKRWVDLTPRQSRIILNRTLRCIVISASSDPNLRFEVFERLNTGGVPLNDQELRNSIFRGSFNKTLHSLAQNKNWLELLDRVEPDKRLQHHEMILRFFAMLDSSEPYKPPLKAWLNDYMQAHRHASDEELARLQAKFLQAVQAVSTVFGPPLRPFRRARSVDKTGITWDNTINRPVFELQMLGLMDVPRRELQAKKQRIAESFARLCVRNEAFSDALSRATADRSRTRLRMQVWSGALKELGITAPALERLPDEA